MILSVIAAALSMGAGHQGDTVVLSRVFKPGEKLEYEVKSSINAQHRQRGIETWIPDDFDLNYKFTTEVKTMKADGVVDLIYLRPTTTTIDGETFDSPPKTTVDKTKQWFLLTVSPANEILAEKDLTPPKKDKKGDGGDKSLRLTGKAGARQGIPFIGQFIGEVHRLALFAGGFDSGLDFAPRLSFDKLKVGDTWKRTVGYSPQKLKGKDGKTVVQRLDYLYTYKGIVDSNGKKVYRVTVDCSLDSNLADFVNQTFDAKPEDTGLKSIPLQLKATINFDLDLATKKTLLAQASSEGGFKVIVTDYPNDPVEEETFKGHTEMRLLNQTIAKPTAKAGKITRS